MCWLNPWFKRLRENVGNINWLNAELMDIARKMTSNEDFRTFDCSSFFRSPLEAELNEKRYTKRKKYLDRKEKQIRYFLSKLEQKKGTQ